jgi:hypothetical protein
MKNVRKGDQVFLRNKKYQLVEILEKLRNRTVQNFTVFLCLFV